VTDYQAGDESHRAPVSEEPDHAEVGARGDQDEDPDSLLGRWLSQIRDAERRAEREAAAIRLR
jgi:hypothetical protein